MDTKALRQKILDLAIRGKLVPQDPNDEPASALLERIRDQKQQMVKEGKIKKKDIKNDSVIFVGEDNLHYEKFADGSVKCIEDEIPFELPEGWSWTRIFSITEDLPYGTAKKSLPTGLVAVLRMGNIQSGEIDYSDLVYSSDGDDIVKYTLIKNDLLFNRTNSAEWVGKTAIYRGNMPAIYAGYLIRIRTFINAEYLNVVMNSGYAKSYCNSVKTDGVNQSNINAQKLGNFLVPIPSFGEQYRISSSIADILPRISIIQDEKDYITDLIQKTKSKILDLAIRGQLVPQNPDDEPASALLERIRAEKKELIKQGKIKRDKKESIIFKGEDNSYYEKIGKTNKCIDSEIPFEIPNSWLWCRLESIGNWQTGSTPSRRNDKYYGGSIPWIKTGDLNNGYIIDIPEYITEKALNETAVKLIPAGTVLIAMYGATIGKVGITTCEATTNQACCACCNPYGVLPEYLFYYLQSQKENFINMAEGGAQPNISKEKIVATLIPIPPYEKQAQIVSIIKIFNNHIESIEKGAVGK